MLKVTSPNRRSSLGSLVALTLMLSLSLVPTTTTAWMTAASPSRAQKNTRLYYENPRDEVLSEADIARLAEMRSRHQQIPIMIVEDALLPGQALQFGSGDPKFHKLVAHVLETNSEIGMIGLNPTTGLPLNFGVTLSLCDKNIKSDASGALVITATGQRRFEVQGEPSLDDDTGSFYVAQVEIVDHRDEPLSEHLQEQTVQLSEKIPQLVEDWIEWIVRTGKSDWNEIKTRLQQELGPMPDSITERAIWVAALINPPLHAQQVCLEVRPAMLACKNDLQRMHLACAAIQSSIDHLSGKRKLF